MTTIFHVGSFVDLVRHGNVRINPTGPFEVLEVEDLVPHNAENRDELLKSYIHPQMLTVVAVGATGAAKFRRTAGHFALNETYDPGIEDKARSDADKSGSSKNPYEGGSKDWFRYHNAFTDQRRIHAREKHAALRQGKEKPTRQQIEAKRATNRQARQAAMPSKGKAGQKG